MKCQDASDINIIAIYLLESRGRMAPLQNEGEEEWVSKHTIFNHMFDTHFDAMIYTNYYLDHQNLNH